MAIGGRGKFCEICGTRPAIGRHAVEGALLSVCEKCGKFGAPIREVFLKGVRPKRADESDLPEVVPDFGRVIRVAREKAHFTQKELAAKVTERESVLVKIEQGVLIPSGAAAVKLERVLGIRLFSASGETTPAKTVGKKPVQKEEGMTLGDVIKLK
jgi:putative transcription factor